jgi:hypothetical protein
LIKCLIEEIEYRKKLGKLSWKFYFY